jgi:hypothetical protein
MLSKKLIIPFIAALLVAAVSCKKNVPGVQGEPGTPGKSGNMKLYHVSTESQPASAWFDGGTGWESTISTPQITNSVLSKCEVDVYMQVGGAWRNLPYAEGDLFMQFSIEVGRVRLKYIKIHGYPEKPVATNFRVAIMIPA